MKKSIRLSINGNALSAEVEPRLQLADFLREHLLLTGTHLGCEHGVCGACTVEIDGAPARSCIAYAVACDGAEVRTIEGFDDDAVMADLREAFSAEHALQCGYCTPGMLVTARDIVLRLPGADEARIREELSGNLCRCTGYVGIVRAIESVLALRKTKGFSGPSVERSPFDSGATRLRSGRTADKDAASPSSVRPEPFDSGAGAYAQDKLRAAESKDERPESQPVVIPRKAASVSMASETAASRSAAAAGSGKPQTTLHQSFTVDHPRDRVWEFFGRLDEVTTCLPGASVIGTPSDDHVDIKLQVKLGPIVPEFAGSADVLRDQQNYSGTIRGTARDVRSGSATRGEIRYILLEEKGGAATRVDLNVNFTLTGPLAQFSRSSIVQDIAKRMTAAFAQNLQARLNQRESGSSAHRVPGVPVSELDAGSLFFSVLWNRIKTFFGRLLG